MLCGFSARSTEKPHRRTLRKRTAVPEPMEGLPMAIEAVVIESIQLHYRQGMRAILGLSYLLLVLLYAYSRIQLIDDAYIFLRYAHNIARGYGYVYNVGSPVEGATSISWTLVLAAIDAIGLPLERATEALAFGIELAIVA